MVRKRCCENCVFSGKVRDGEKILYVCSNVPDCPGQTVLRPADGVCPHFRLRPGRTPKSPPKPSDDPWVRYIPLTQGLYAKVDASDYGWLSLHNWWAIRAGNTYYAERAYHGKRIMMHQEIMVPAEGYVVDHIDGEGWNNCRDNLRNCTRTQNSRNRRKQRKPATSPYKGVRRNRKYGKCRVYIGHEGRKIYLGTFWDEIEAARAYDRAAVKFHGPFARLNFPEEWVTGEWKPVDPEPEDEDPNADDAGQKTEDG